MRRLAGNAISVDAMAICGLPPCVQMMNSNHSSFSDGPSLRKACLMRTVNRLREAVRMLGIGNTCLYVIARLLAAISGGRCRIVKYYFTAQPVVFPRGDERSGSFVVEFADPDSPLLEQMGRPSNVLAARFAQGARCLAATANTGHLAGFLWFVVGPYEEDEIRAQFCPKPDRLSAWDFDVAIMPRYRMSRLFGYLWKCASAELARLGVCRTISRISAFNVGSLAAHRRLGAQIVGEATFICVGRWQLMRASLPPYWHLSSGAERRPTLEIGADFDVVPDASDCGAAHDVGKDAGRHE